VIYAAIGANAAVAITKFVVAAASSSSSMLSEAFHSTVDTGDQLLLLLGKRRGARPPDEQHPYGHGKEYYFWGLIVAMVLFGAGGGLSVYEGVRHLLHPRELSDPVWVYVVLGVSAFFESSSWTVAFRELWKSRSGRSLWSALRGSKDPSVYTVLAEDSAALVGLVLAFFGVLLTQITGNPRFDGIASIAIGCVLTLVAAFLAYETRSLLVGESDPEVARTVRRVVESDPTVRSAGAPLTMQLGPDEVLVNLGVQFRGGLGAEEIARTIDRLEEAIRREHPQVTRVFIEAERSKCTG
jgi:cation diffusion facilitator family transporter